MVQMYQGTYRGTGVPEYVPWYRCTRVRTVVQAYQGTYRGTGVPEYAAWYSITGVPPAGFVSYAVNAPTGNLKR